MLVWSSTLHHLDAARITGLLGNLVRRDADDDTAVGNQDDVGLIVHHLKTGNRSVLITVVVAQTLAAAGLQAVFLRLSVRLPRPD